MIRLLRESSDGSNPPNTDNNENKQTPGENPKPSTSPQKPQQVESKEDLDKKKKEEEIKALIQNVYKRISDGYSGLTTLCDSAIVRKNSNLINENKQLDFYILDEEDDANSEGIKYFKKTETGKKFISLITEENDMIAGYGNDSNKLEENFSNRWKMWCKYSGHYSKTISPQLEFQNEKKLNDSCAKFKFAIDAIMHDAPIIISYRRKQMINYYKSWIYRIVNWFRRKKEATSDSYIPSYNNDIDVIFNETLYFSTTSLPLVTNEITNEELMLMENIDFQDLLMELNDETLQESALVNGILGTLNNTIRNIGNLFFKRDKALNDMSEAFTSTCKNLTAAIEKFSNSDAGLLSYDKWRILIEEPSMWQMLFGAVALLAAFGILRRSWVRIRNWFIYRFKKLIGSPDAENYRHARYSGY